MYFEKWIEESRHVEVQVIVDRHGNGAHLGERDCSIQRRHQKIIEEGPSPAMDAASRERLRDPQLLPAAGYESAGTLEFLLDGDGNFYFIEINCRIQVEHLVTEMLTGVDITAEQIRVAAGELLKACAGRGRPPRPRDRVQINAEDPNDKLRRRRARSSRLCRREGREIDTHLFPGYEVPPYYDSLLAKLIVWGETREVALARSRRGARRVRRSGREDQPPIPS